MEEADTILVMGIKDLNLAVEPSVKTIKQLIDSDPSLVYQASVAFVRQIDATKEFPENLPRHMSSRVSACGALAGAIKELGYRGDLGYHQLLYPSENDVRQLLMWLTKQAASSKEDSAQPTSSSSSSKSSKREEGVNTTMQRIGAALSDAAKAGWTVPAVAAEDHRRVMKELRPFHASPLRVPMRGRMLKTTPGLEAYWSSDLMPMVWEQPDNGARGVSATIFEYLTMSLAEARERENNHQATLDSGLNPIQYKDKKRAAIASQVASAFRSALQTSSATATTTSGSASLMTELLASYAGGAEKTEKGRFGRQVDFQQEKAEAEKAAREAAEERLVKQQSDLEGLLAEVSAAQSEAMAAMESIAGLDERARQSEAAAMEVEGRLKVLEREFRVKKRTYDLLPEAEANIRELKRIADGAARRLVELAAEWEKHRAPLVDELRKLQDLADEAMSETRVKLVQVKNMREEIRHLVDEIRSKDDRHKQLVEAYRVMIEDQQKEGEGEKKEVGGRTQYTRRILDIVKNVKKQKLDISKILEDTRTLQKEINSVRDTLGRSFSVADELIYQDAKKEAVKPVRQQDMIKRDIYKQLVTLNETFTKLVDAIEEVGQSKGGVLNVEAKIEQAMARATASATVQRLQEDLKQIRETNAALQSKVSTLQ